MPVYLEYLAGRLTAAGGRIELRTVTSLLDLAAEAPLIVNCAGLGARELAADDSLTPIRGQHVIVDNPGLEEFFIEAPFTPAWAAYWPYPDHVVLGGTQSTEDASIEPDPQIARDPAALHRDRAPSGRRTGPRPPGRATPSSTDRPARGRADRWGPLRAQLRARRVGRDAVVGQRVHRRQPAP